MNKAPLLFSLISFVFLGAQNIAFTKLYGNADPTNYYLGSYPVSGTDGLSIKWDGGIRLITNTDNSIIQMLGNGNVGIGNNLPTEKLDVSGNILLRNYINSSGAGSSIFFTSYGTDSPGARINTSLDFASGADSRSSLILSSYWNRYMNEITLRGGNVGIGTENPQYTLDVNGKAAFSNNVLINAKLETREVTVTNTPTADFVFSENYKLPSLEEVELNIKANKHLPEVSSAKEMEKYGVNVGEFQIKLLQKIEELTLYSIEQNKQNKILQLRVEKLEKTMSEKK